MDIKRIIREELNIPNHPMDDMSNDEIDKYMHGKKLDPNDLNRLQSKLIDSVDELRIKHSNRFTKLMELLNRFHKDNRYTEQAEEIWDNVRSYIRSNKKKINQKHKEQSRSSLLKRYK